MFRPYRVIFSLMLYKTLKIAFAKISSHKLVLILYNYVVSHVRNFASAVN